MKQAINNRRKLSYRLLIAVLLCSTVLTIITSAFQLYFDYKKDVSSIHENIQFIRDSYLPAMTASVYAFNDKQVEMLLDGALNIVNIEYVEIKDSLKKTYKSKGDPAASKDVKKTFDLSHTSQAGEVFFLGTLNISASFRGIYQRLWEKAFVIIISNMVKTFFAAILIFMIINHLVIRHLVRISDYLQRRSIDNLENQLRLDGTFAEENELSQVVMSINDMNKKFHRNINELRLSEERFRTLVMNIPGTSYRFFGDAQRTVAFISDEIERLSGYPASDFLENRERSYTSLIHPEDLARVEKAVKQGIDQKTKYILEYRIVHASGDLCWVFEKGQCLFDEAGQLAWLDGVIVDITKRKKAEEKRKQLEAQLRQSHKMEAVGTIAGGIAHDFNNILGIIIGNMELTLDSIEDGHPASRNLEQIKKASYRATDVVRQLLNFSRKTEPVRKTLDLGMVINESMKLLRSIIPSSIAIKQDTPLELKPVKADPTQIHQLLLNLCTNAVHAMEKDGGTLNIQLCEIQNDSSILSQFTELKAGQYLQLKIEDTGQGIDPATQTKIFDPYFTTKAIGKGSGMGLAVVLGIVKNHNGAIDVYSKPGRGSSFHVLLPVTHGRQSRPQETATVLPTGNETILLVDDEQALLDIGYSILTRLGYTVECKTDPVEALGLFRSEPDRFDLVLTDMTMPGLEGDQLASEILKINPDVPVILCTGFSHKMDTEKADRLGVHSYIEKPLEKRRLAVLIRQALD